MPITSAKTDNEAILENIFSLVMFESGEKIKVVSNRYFEAMTVSSDKSIEEIKSDFLDLVRTHLMSKVQYLSSVDSVKKQYRQILNPIARLKKRWVNMALESYEGKKNCLMKNEYLELKREIIRNQKILSLDIDNLTEFYEYRKNSLEEWRRSKYLVSDFIYLSELSESKINSAIKYDVYKIALDILVLEYDGNIFSSREQNISQLSSSLFQPVKPGRKANGTGVKKEQTGIYTSDKKSMQDRDGNLVDSSYVFDLAKEFPDDYAYNLNRELLSKEESKTSLSKAMSTIALDELDLKIIRLIYSNNNNTSETSFLIEYFVKRLNLENKPANIKKVEDKLLKLPYYAFYMEKQDELNPDTQIRASFNLFSKVYIANRVDGKRFATVTYSNGILANKVSTQNLYRSQLRKLKSIDSVNLAYFLEGERVHRLNFLGKSPSEPLVINLQQFEWYVYMDKKIYNTLNKKIELLRNLLNEIVENNFIIKNFEINELSGQVAVYFYEETEKLKDLFSNIDILNNA